MPLQLTVSCFRKIQIGFAFLVPADPRNLGKRAVKRARVCVEHVQRGELTCVNGRHHGADECRRWLTSLHRADH